MPAKTESADNVTSNLPVKLPDVPIQGHLIVAVLDPDIPHRHDDTGVAKLLSHQLQSLEHALPVATVREVQTASVGSAHKVGTVSLPEGL